MYTKYSLPNFEDIEFEQDRLRIPVLVERIEEKYEGSARDEEYFEENVFATETVLVECPLKNVSKNSSNKKWTGEDAIDILENVTEDEITIQDFGTVEVEIGETKYCVSYDTSELDKYQ